ncbi:MAG TPA: hypothetical protein VFB62_26495 [Polyangiaceae bacterium]|nr:hypothetical protein [Polyangiaceae bacterium]
METARFIIQMGVRSVLPLMMLALGLSLDYREVAQWVRRPLIARGLLVGLLGVPCFAMLVVAVLPVRPTVAGVVLLAAIAPGAPLLMLPVRRQKGSMAGALTLALVLTFTAVVMLPLALTVLERLFGFEFRAAVPDVMVRVFVPLAIATLAGMLVRARAPRVARQLAPVVLGIFKGAFALVIVLLLVRILPRLPHIGVWDFVAMLVVTVGSAVIGHFAGGKRPEDQSLLATAAVYGNPAIVLYVAQASYPTVDIAPIIVLYILLRAVAQIPFRRWERRQLRRALGATT